MGADVIATVVDMLGWFIVIAAFALFVGWVKQCRVFEDPSA